MDRPEHHGEEEHDLERVRALELQLLDPAVRRDRATVARLLHPEFREVGASGRAWDAATVLRTLEDDPGEAVEVAELAAERLAPHVVLVTYRARAAGRWSLRASVWVRDARGWRVRHHQGTPCGDRRDAGAERAP